MLQNAIRVEGDRRRGMVALASWVITATLISLPGLWLVLDEQNHAREAESAFWSMSGPPCAPLTKARFYRSSAPPSPTLYEGVLFQRRAGHMLCMRRPYPGRAREDRFPACRFTGPDYLAVSAAG